MRNLSSVKSVNRKICNLDKNEQDQLVLGSQLVYDILTSNVVSDNLVCRDGNHDKFWFMIPFEVKNMGKTTLDYKLHLYQSYDEELNRFKLNVNYYIGFSLFELERLALAEDNVVSLVDDCENGNKLSLDITCCDDMLDFKCRTRDEQV